MKASPKQLEKGGLSDTDFNAGHLGSVPVINWYWVWREESIKRLTGGKAPKASQVNKMMFLG